MTPYYADDLVTIYHGDCREWMPEADVLITDPPYGVNFVGKTYQDEKIGYISGDDPEAGPAIVRMILPRVKRAAVFPGIRLLSRYPEPYDIGCVFCPAGVGTGRWGFTLFHPVLFYGKRPTSNAYPASIISTSTEAQTMDAKGHPCPKPLRWMTWLVQLASLPGESVLDPFAGTGTTLFAAKSLGRRAIGIEIEERYCEIAANRCRQEVLGLAQ
jgi:site-specific DNA-methyltransferase (adenine-specific)